MIKVTNEVAIREIDGKKPSGFPPPTITVASHWNWDTLVVLIIDGKKVTVAARELQAAVNNATYTSR